MLRIQVPDIGDGHLHLDPSTCGVIRHDARLFGPGSRSPGLDLQGLAVLPRPSEQIYLAGLTLSSIPSHGGNIQGSCV